MSIMVSTKFFFCRVCPALKFTDEKSYLLHIRESHNGKTGDSKMCEACGKTFQTGSQLKCHKKSKCGTEKSFTCNVCEKKLMSASSLHNHMKMHTEKAKLMCAFCAKLFHFIGQLKVHEKIHTKEKNFICEECSKAFSYRQSLITHMSIHSGVKPYKCEGCGRSFSCVSNLLKHRKTFAHSCGALLMSSHTVQNPLTKRKVLLNTPNSCRLKRIEMKTKLEEKISQIENTENKKSNARQITVSNPWSNHGMVQDSSVNEVVKNHLLLSEENSNNQSEGQSSENNMHNLYYDQETLVEQNKYPAFRQYLYVCEICGKTFKCKFMLDTHQKSNCDEVLIHKCNICDKFFSNKYSLKAHIKMHTSDKEWSCKFCKKCFQWKGQVKIHERSHTGEKPFTCLFCPSSFTYRESLLIHSYKHTGNKPYDCKCCGLRFSCIGNLKKHKQTHFDSCGLWYREHERRLNTNTRP